MKIRMVTQYGCDYCKKKMYRKDAMVRHEKYCTMNLNRQCRMCDKAEDEDYHADIPQLLSMIPEPIETNESYGDLIRVDEDEEGHVCVYWRNFIEIKKSWENVRELARCPACLLAVLRQSELNRVVNFDYKKECESFWADFKPEWGVDF